MSSKTLELFDYFDKNFNFTEEHLRFIEQVSKETDIDREIIKEVLFYLFKNSFKEIHLTLKDEVSIEFPHFTLNNLNQKR